MVLPTKSNVAHAKLSKMLTYFMDKGLLEQGDADTVITLDKEKADSVLQVLANVGLEAKQDGNTITCDSAALNAADNVLDVFDVLELSDVKPWDIVPDVEVLDLPEASNEPAAWDVQALVEALNHHKEEGNFCLRVASGGVHPTISVEVNCSGERLESLKSLLDDNNIKHADPLMPDVQGVRIRTQDTHKILELMPPLTEFTADDLNIGSATARGRQ